MKKKVEDSITILSELMTPNFTNLGGKVHGGALLKLMDNVAFVTAMKHCGSTCVTAAIDKVVFFSPVELGDVITMTASVNFVGKTSMEVGIRVISLNPLTGKSRHTNSSYFTMVCLNSKGKPSIAPQLILSTPEQRRRWKDAELRRNKR